MRFLFSLLTLTIISACQSNPTASATQSGSQAKSNDYFLSQGYKQLTFIGESEAPRFSETGNEIIFISRQRPAHKGAQVYELDLIKNRERRMTFHDGDDSCASYLNGREVMYCSTTDEIKESPFLNKNIDKDYPPTEVYSSDNFGDTIERLTTYPGFDNEALFVKNFIRPYVIFTSRRGGTVGIFKLEPKSKQVSFIAVEKDKESRYPALSGDRKQLAWIERDLKTEQNLIRVMPLKAKKSEVVKEGGGQYRDLIWDPDNNRLFYSVLRTGDTRYQLEAYDIDKKCTQSLFKGVDSLIQPAISNERKPKIAFTRLFQGKKQIYMVDLPANLGPCFEASSQPKLEK